MNMKGLICPKCESIMIEGLIIEHRGRIMAEKSFHWGLEVRKTGFRTPKVQLHAIVPFRCQKCGYLEFYSPTEKRF